MNSKYELLKLSDVCTFENGDRGKNYPSRTNFVSDGTPFINAGHLVNGEISYEGMNYISESVFNRLGRGKFFKDDLLFCLRGSLGKYAIAKEGDFGAIASSLVIVRPRKNVLNYNYLGYYFNSSICANMISKYAGGAAQPNLGAKDLMKFLLPVPPLGEQQEIVKILQKKFAAIDQAKVNIEKNIENAKELFQSKLNEIFSQKGEGWEEKRFDEICDFTRGPFGGSLKKSCFVEEGYAVYEQQHAINNQFSSIRYFVDNKKFKEMERFELKPGDLIMSCSGTMGKVAIVPEEIKKGIINQALLKLTPKGNIQQTFLKKWMESTHFYNEIAKHSKGAAIKNVASVKVLKEIMVPYTDLEQQKIVSMNISELESQIFKVIETYEKKVTDLEDLKKSILQKAFAGELIEKEIEV